MPVCIVIWPTQLTAEKRAIMVAAKHSKLMGCPDTNSRAVQKQSLLGYIHDVIRFPVADKSFFSKQLRDADLLIT